MTIAIYHEKQFSSMCGQHCLNNLLQGPYYQAADLAEIAADLDKAESELLGTTTGESSNVDNAGNFSIQVLNAALQRSHGLQLVQNPQLVQAFLQSLNASGPNADSAAFVLNLSQHWFSIRNIFGDFWDLNSLHKQPTKISKFFLSAYLAQFQAEGWSIFTVQGELPALLLDFSSIGERTNWFIPGVDDIPVEGAATTTPTDSNQFAPFQGEGNRLSSASYDEDLQLALQMSRGEGTMGNEEEDEDMRKAIELSLGDTAKQQLDLPREPEPEKGDANAICIQFELLNGKKVRRRFGVDELVSVLFGYLQNQIEQNIQPELLVLKLRGEDTLITLNGQGNTPIKDHNLKSATLQLIYQP